MSTSEQQRIPPELVTGIDVSEDSPNSAGGLRSEARASVQDVPALATERDILARATRQLEETGLVGEERAAALIFLALVSRLLQKPVSLALKAPSSAGKSYVVKRVLELFPTSAYHALTAMSERALAYSREPLSHRVLVLYEAAGMQEFASYLVRSLLSEGCIRYETVDPKTLQARLIEREGPTGLIVTTTAISLHPENETRLLSVPMTDTAQQTRAILLAQATEDHCHLDPKPWWELQEWLATGPQEVTVPFGQELAKRIPAAAVRLRRDFPALLGLIRAHALLHRATRQIDERGRVVATLDDYVAVRRLTADLLAEGVRLTVSPETRETVEAVAKLAADGAREGVSNKQIATQLRLDESAASRRARKARDGGYLVNLEDKRGKPARYVLGEPMPEDFSILPEASELAEPCTLAPFPPGGADREVTGAPIRADESGASNDLPVATDVEQARYERAVEWSGS
jgi:hypothetical protein